MLPRFFALLVLAASPAAAQNAAAPGPSYSAGDIEAFFAPALDCQEGRDCAPKVRTRAVCIGTSSACATETAAAPDPGGFDMLITFELGSDRLSPQARENLAEFARALKGDRLGNTTFNIDGHTDARGSDSFNLDLSNRRAEAVVSYLESLGIPRDRLQAQGHGESSPRTEDPFAAINRRVEATLRIE
jgi:outer membrane protein OmpA-like peptidoglycan-associated protein